MREVPKVWAQYTYYDPTIVLSDLRRVREALSESDTPKRIRNLRTNRLKHHRESWDAAIFCKLLSLATGEKILFSRKEDEDFDSVFFWKNEHGQNFAPIQLKELVPRELNPEASLAKILDGIREKYCSSDLIVGIRLNQRTQLNFQSLDLSDLQIRELWMFGATSPDCSRWSLFGEFLCGSMQQHEFTLERA
jgi:hypothetical protein